MKKLISLSLLILVFHTNCKKKDTKDPEKETTTTGNPTPSAPTTFNGMFVSGSYTLTAMGFTSTGPTGSAYFSSQPTSLSTGTSIRVGSVYLNGDSLIFPNNVPSYIRAATSPALQSTASWSVNGGNGIPSFTYDHTDPAPSYAGFTVPDSISKSGGFSISINNVANISQASIIVADYTAIGTLPAVKNLVAGNNTVTFSAADLASINTGSTTVIIVNLANAKGVTLSGKGFRFSKECQLTKYIKVKS